MARGEAARQLNGAAARAAALLDGGAAPADAPTDGCRLAFRVGACRVLGAVVVAAAVLRDPPGTGGAPTTRADAARPVETEEAAEPDTASA
ncbi:hypothetical protein [Streptomyces sp. 16-176A]|uniref:hypothetical protein n=1 Tax=Streptomyces sp. 16-176A TaxID=2530458 RepID=UPI00345D870C